ncbi:MAG TPA: hypothetical protein VFI02_19785 [Armatimonadota bacterium]|nr:hypothetical protein [Armatimonadota bacterium]
MMSGAWQASKDIVVWCHKEFRESAENLMRDFRSLRALWNWIYLALYVFLCVWTALYYPAALPTAIITTGTIVGTIFTVYVASNSYEKVARMNNGHMKPAAPVKPEKPEDELSD